MKPQIDTDRHKELICVYLHASRHNGGKPQRQMPAEGNPPAALAPQGAALRNALPRLSAVQIPIFKSKI
ncbi:MAG: hypothetical protein HC862_28705 [Scytonema sp. RU_4_4]|nr:hypothetical protein [Scytonema sp. RU_4_4]